MIKRAKNRRTAVMRDLARMPATSTHIATKLARHFAGDEPPPALVARLAAAFTETDGHLPTIYRVLIDAPEAWVPQPVKFKTPWDWLISALRGIGQKTLDRLQALEMMVELGQSVWRARLAGRLRRHRRELGCP